MSLLHLTECFVRVECLVRVEGFVRLNAEHKVFFKEDFFLGPADLELNTLFESNALFD